MNAHIPQEPTPLRGHRRVGCGAILAILLLMLVLAAFGFGYLYHLDMQQIIRSLPWSG